MNYFGTNVAIFFLVFRQLFSLYKRITKRLNDTNAGNSSTNDEEGNNADFQL